MANIGIWMKLLFILMNNVIYVLHYGGYTEIHINSEHRKMRYISVNSLYSSHQTSNYSIVGVEGRKYGNPNTEFGIPNWRADSKCVIISNCQQCKFYWSISYYIWQNSRLSNNNIYRDMNFHGRIMNLCLCSLFMTVNVKLIGAGTIERGKLMKDFP